MTADLPTNQDIANARFPQGYLKARAALRICARNFTPERYAKGAGGLEDRRGNTMTYTVEIAAIGWSVNRSDGEVMGRGLSNSQAWALADRLDQDAVKMENTRLRIAEAFSDR